MTRTISSVRLVAGLLAATSITAVAHAGDISGNVADATQTRPLQAATITVPELNRNVQTDRDGHYIIGDVPAGDYTLVASYVGADTQTVTVSVPATGNVAENFALAGFGGDYILVVGQAANLASALSRKKAADGVEDVLTRDAIGEFPDQNVAESLRRLPGINILNDQGEGRFVSIRGLDPNLNSTSLNGVRVTAPESDIRAVALDVISSDTIESITVKKSLTPDMDADAIGGSVEIKTTSAFDRKKDYLGLRAEGSYNDYNGQITPKGSVDFSKRFGDDFGVAGSFSYYRRKFETDNNESDPWKIGDDGTPYSETIEYRDYDVTRTRINAGLSFDWRASDTTDIYLRGNWSQFDDHEYRRRTTFDFGKFDQVSSVSGDMVSFDDADASIKIERDLKDRFERQRIKTVVLGGDTDTGTWKANWSASYTKSSEEEAGSIDPIRFSNKFSKKGVVIDWDYSDPHVPFYTVTGGADLVNDPAQYGLDKIEVTTLSDSQDREYALKGDLARTFTTDNGDFTIQAGAKQRWRKKTYNKTQTDYEGNDDLTMAGFTGAQTYRLHGISLGPVLAKSAGVDFFDQYGGMLELNDDDTLIDSISDDYGATEDITAAYALARWDSDTLRVIGGVRMEHTHNELNGNLYNEDTLDITPVSFTRDYTDWLPSLTFRWSNGGNVVARLAGYRSLMRPNLSDLAPRFSTNDDDEAKFGNPNLLPYKAWNLDFGMEYYFTSNGAITFGAFYKSVDNFIVTRYFSGADAFSDVTNTLYSELRIPENGASAEIAGLEAGYSQAFTMLPSPFDGLLAQANYTYTYSQGTVYDGDDNPYRTTLPANSKHTFNVVLGYDKGPLDLRLAGTYRSKYLDELGGSREEDRWVDNHFQLDFTGKISVMHNIKLTFDVININNAKYFAYQDFAGARRLLQFEKYGPTYKAGVRVNF